VLSYDGHVFYEPVERISAPEGLGALKELEYLRRATTRPFKITAPGAAHARDQITRGGRTAIGSRSHRTWRPIINRELRALAAGGARNLQLDDVYQSFLHGAEAAHRALRPVLRRRRGGAPVLAHLLRHAGGFGYGERTYRPLFPAICG